MKRVIQICSMLVLAAAFSVVSAQAQTLDRINAKIPFNFNVGDKSYDAGEYIIKTSRLSDSTVQVSLADSNGNTLQNFLVFSAGETAGGKERLVFAVYNDRHYLSKILTNGKGLLLTQVEPEK